MPKQSSVDQSTAIKEETEIMATNAELERQQGNRSQHPSDQTNRFDSHPQKNGLVDRQ